MMFISNAFATTVDSMAQNAPGGGDWIQLLLQIALVFLVLYLLLIRPQQKRFKEHEKALNSIKKGTKVIVGGIIGSVTTIEEDKVKDIRSYYVTDSDIRFFFVRGDYASNEFGERSSYRYYR